MGFGFIVVGSVVTSVLLVELPVGGRSPKYLPISEDDVESDGPPEPQAPANPPRATTTDARMTCECNKK